MIRWHTPLALKNPSATSHEDTRAYPCRTREKALELANRFLAGVTSAASAKAVVTKGVPQNQPAQ